MRIIGQVLIEGAGTPLGGVTVRIARRGAGNVLLTLMTNSRGEFESELSDDFLVEPALVFTASREGYLETRLERAPAPEMQVALGVQPVRRAPDPIIQPPPVAARPPLLLRVGKRLLPVAIVLVVQFIAQNIVGTYLISAAIFIVVYGLILGFLEKRADQKAPGAVAGRAPPP